MLQEPTDVAPSWLQAAAKLGVPAVIALAVVAFLMATVYGQLVATAKEATLERHLEQQRHASQTLERMLRLICLHQADTEFERSECLR